MMLQVSRACGLLLAALEPAMAQEPLSQQEMMEALVGHCISYTGPSIGVQCIYQDGRVTYDDSVDGQGTGTWEMRGEDFCALYDGDPADCGKVYRLDDQSFTDGYYSWCSLGPVEAPLKSCP